MNQPTRHLALCLDPVHVGTGGYRLGRVDMSIVRDPATGIPKIPGTSLAGAVRAYAELAKAEDNSLPEINEVFGTAEETKGNKECSGSTTRRSFSSPSALTWARCG